MMQALGPVSRASSSTVAAAPALAFLAPMARLFLLEGLALLAAMTKAAGSRSQTETRMKPSTLKRRFFLSVMSSEYRLGGVWKLMRVFGEMLFIVRETSSSIVFFMNTNEHPGKLK